MSRAAIDFMEEIRQRYGGTENEGLQSGHEEGSGTFGWKADKIDELINTGAIKYNEGSGKFDIPHQDRIFLGIDDADVGRALLIKDQRARNATILKETGKESGELGINAASSTSSVNDKLKQEGNYRRGETQLEESRTSLKELNELPGFTFDPNKRYTSEELAPAFKALEDQRRDDTPSEKRAVQNQEESLKNSQATRELAEERLALTKANSEKDDAWRKHQLEVQQVNARNDRAQRNFELKMSREERRDKGDMELQIAMMDRSDRRADREARREDRLASQRQQSIMQLIKGLSQMGAGFAI